MVLKTLHRAVDAEKRDALDSFLKLMNPQMKYLQGFDRSPQWSFMRNFTHGCVVGFSCCQLQKIDSVHTVVVLHGTNISGACFHAKWI